ncbi:MAG: copper resistance protein CopC [Mycobacteriales bacterium]
MRLATRVLAVVLVAAGLTGGWPAAASAHAVLRGSNPAAGARIGSVPAVVTVRFNEPVEAGLGALRVYGPDGRRADTGGTGRGQGGPATMAVRLRRGLPRGTYTVAWRVTSADSHAVAGAFAFGVGGSAGAGGAPQPAAVAGAGGSGSGERAVGLLAGVARWVAFAGFALLVGTGAFVALCWPAGARRVAVRRIALAGWSALIVATVVALALQGPHATGRGLGSVADPAVWRATAATRLGRALTVRLLLLAAARWYLSWLFSRAVAAARAERRALRGSGLVLAAGVAATVSAAGHAGVGRQVALAFPADLAHLLAMGAWLGGLVVLVAVLRTPGAADSYTGRAEAVRPALPDRPDGSNRPAHPDHPDHAVPALPEGPGPRAMERSNEPDPPDAAGKPGRAVPVLREGPGPAAMERANEPYPPDESDRAVPVLREGPGPAAMECANEPYPPDESDRAVAVPYESHRVAAMERSNRPDAPDAAGKPGRAIPVLREGPGPAAMERANEPDAPDESDRAVAVPYESHRTTAMERSNRPDGKPGRAVAVLREGARLAAVERSNEPYPPDESDRAVAVPRQSHRTTAMERSNRPDRAAVDRFSRLAFWCVAVLATTGLYQTWRQVGSVGALTGTGYGRLVLAKAAGFSVLLALGARARRVLAGRRGDVPPRLRSGVLAEVAVGAAVLAATAVLVNVAPGRELATPATASAAATHVGHGGHVHASLLTRTVAFGPGTVTAVVDPARPGWNTITLTVRGAAPPVEVTAAFALAKPAVGPMAVALAGAGPGRYVGAGIFLPLPGDWRLTAVIRTSPIDETTITVPVALSP